MRVVLTTAHNKLVDTTANATVNATTSPEVSQVTLLYDHVTLLYNHVTLLYDHVTLLYDHVKGVSDGSTFNFVIATPLALSCGRQWNPSLRIAGHL